MRLHCSVSETNIGKPRGKVNFNAIKLICFSIATHKVIALKTSVLHFYIGTLFLFMLEIVKVKKILLLSYLRTTVAIATAGRVMTYIEKAI